jgi:hypothetical protein
VQWLSKRTHKWIIPPTVTSTGYDTTTNPHIDSNLMLTVSVNNSRKINSNIDHEAKKQTSSSQHNGFISMRSRLRGLGLDAHLSVCTVFLSPSRPVKPYQAWPWCGLGVRGWSPECFMNRPGSKNKGIIHRQPGAIHLSFRSCIKALGSNISLIKNTSAFWEIDRQTERQRGNPVKGFVIALHTVSEIYVCFWLCVWLKLLCIF